jgi:hypothetical protein
MTNLGLGRANKQQQKQIPDSASLGAGLEMTNKKGNCRKRKTGQASGVSS